MFQCSAECGTGIQTRKVFCATFEDEDTMKKVPDSKCESEEKFNNTRECTAKGEECKGEWFAGPWSTVSSVLEIMNKSSKTCYQHS